MVLYLFGPSTVLNSNIGLYIYSVIRIRSSVVALLNVSWVLQKLELFFESKEYKNAKSCFFHSGPSFFFEEVRSLQVLTLAGYQKSKRLYNKNLLF